MSMKIQVMVFWVMTPHNDAVGHQCFWQPGCLHLQGCGIVQWCGTILHPEDRGSIALWNVWYPTTSLRGVKTHKIITQIFGTCSIKQVFPFALHLIFIYYTMFFFSFHSMMPCQVIYWYN